MTRFFAIVLVSACLVAGIFGAPSEKIDKDETLDTAAQGIVGYSPGLYNSAILGGPGYSQVVSQHTTHRVVKPGYANIGYGYNNLGYGAGLGGLGYASPIGYSSYNTHSGVSGLGYVH